MLADTWADGLRGEVPAKLVDYRNTGLVLAEVHDAVLRELAAQELQQAFFPLGSAQKEPRRCSVQQPLQHGRRDVPRPAPSLPSKQDLWIAARRARRGEDSSGESVLRVLLLPHKRWRAGSLGLQAFLVVHAPVQGSLVRPTHADAPKRRRDLTQLRQNAPNLRVVSSSLSLEG